jgi:hypothetical protein
LKRYKFLINLHFFTIDYKSDAKPQSGYSVVDVTDDRKPQPIKPFNDKPVIEIKPLINNKPKENQYLGPKLRTASFNIETFVPESDSFPVTESYDLANSEYTLGSHSQPTGIKPKLNHFYNIENFNKTDSRNNYNLDNIYQPFLPTVSPTVRVDGFNVPLTPTLKSSEQNLNYETTQSPVARNLENNNHRNTIRPTIAPKIQSIGNRNSYTTVTELPKSYYSDVSHENDNNNDSKDSDTNDNVRIEPHRNREPNYYHYEDVGSSPLSVGVGNRDRNNFDLPPIEKPLDVNNRNVGNNRIFMHRNNNIIPLNEEFTTTSPNRLITPNEYYRQLYSNGMHFFILLAQYLNKFLFLFF